MPETVVKCSMPGCRENATVKVAAPWQGGRFTELKTFGFACQAHAEKFLSDARKRAKPQNLSPDETMGEFTSYPL